MPVCLNSAAGSAGGVAARPSTTAAIPRCMFAPWSASPIAASRDVELLLVLGDGRGVDPQPPPEAVDVETRHHIPQRRPEVATGASQSRRSSSSSCVMLTEHPAMSRLVT